MKITFTAKLSTLLIFLFITILPGAAGAKVYIDIDAPGFQQFPIAVCDFQSRKGPTTPADINTAIADHIRHYLDLSGIFNLLDKKSFLDGVEPGQPETIRFSDWSVIGADFLLRGDTIVNGKDIAAESRLYDVTRGQVLFNKRYTGNTDTPRTLAIAIASDILLALTGDEGDLNTRIAFITKKKSGSDIYAMDYGVSETRNLTGHRSILAAPRWSRTANIWLLHPTEAAGRKCICMI